MEELKLLVQMVASLPALAVWVIIAFYIYKITIIGSIYGVIRFITQKIHDMYLNRTNSVKLIDELNGIVITSDNTFDQLMNEIKRVRGKDTGTVNSKYIHECSVNWLKEAIDDKIAKDAIK